MTASSMIRVSPRTRDRVMKIANEDYGGVTADEALQRLADRKTPLAGLVAVKRPPGTATAGQTGTIPPQGGTTDRVLAKAR